VPNAQSLAYETVKETRLTWYLMWTTVQECKNHTVTTNQQDASRLGLTGGAPGAKGGA